MSRIGMLSLICAVISGVFGSGVTPLLSGGKPLFVIFLFLAMAAFGGSSLNRPSLLWEVLDDIHRTRFRNSRSNHTIAAKGSQYDANNACDSRG